MLRILHTADWHLGHALHALPREYEHACFLDWLLDTAEERAVDAVLVCGDVFDSINPPASAQTMFYGFLARLRRRMPGVDVVVIGGNHDSPARLEAAGPLLDAIGVRVLGGVRRAADGQLDAARMVVPLKDAAGEVAGHCAAVPFLRIADLRASEGDGDPLIEGVRDVYARTFDLLRARRRPGDAMIALGHCYMTSTEVSRLSERRILGGNQHALPLDLFPSDVSYAALGHLHKAQRVGRENVRYSGSPIPMSMGEIHYKHQVVIADFDGEQCSAIEPVLVPRAVECLRVPATGFAVLDDVCERLRALPAYDGERAETRPFLEVRVSLDEPRPDLRHRVESALEGRSPRLVKLTVEWTGHGQSLAQTQPTQDLQELAPETVFRSCYERAFDGAPSAAIEAEFQDLLEAVRAGEIE